MKHGPRYTLQRIEAALSAYDGRFVIVALPNITDVLYGRDVGYNIERIVLDEATKAISGTKMRTLTAKPKKAALLPPN